MAFAGPSRAAPLIFLGSSSTGEHRPSRDGEFLPAARPGPPQGEISEYS